MNLQDVRSPSIPLPALKPMPTNGATYDGGNGIVLKVCEVSPYATGTRRYAVCQVVNGKAIQISRALQSQAFAYAQRMLDAYAKRGGYARLP